MSLYQDHASGTPGSATSARGCLVSWLAIAFGVFLCSGTIYVASDVSCASNAHLWLVDYPGSQLVSQEHSFIRPWGIGETTRVLLSPDPPRDVRMWYNRRDSDLARQGNEKRGGLGTLSWRVSESQEGGSLIVLHSNCANVLAFE